MLKFLRTGEMKETWSGFTLWGTPLYAAYTCIYFELLPADGSTWRGRKNGVRKSEILSPNLTLHAIHFVRKPQLRPDRASAHIKRSPEPKLKTCLVHPVFKNRIFLLNSHRSRYISCTTAAVTIIISIIVCCLVLVGTLLWLVVYAPNS